METAQHRAHRGRFSEHNRLTEQGGTEAGTGCDEDDQLIRTDTFVFVFPRLKASTDA